jgi:hypothetical protein
MKISKNKESNLLFRVGIVAAFPTLSFVGTMIIRIPIPVTGGYFNIWQTNRRVPRYSGNIFKSERETGTSGILSC